MKGDRKADEENRRYRVGRDNITYTKKWRYKYSLDKQHTLYSNSITLHLGQRDAIKRYEAELF